MGALVRILDLLLILINSLDDWYKERKRKKEYEEAQKERDKVEKDPVGAFIEHFNSGVRTEEGSSKADTNKANPTISNPN